MIVPPDRRPTVRLGFERNRSEPRTIVPSPGERIGHRRGVPEQTQHICCRHNRIVGILLAVTSQEFKRWLQKQGCTFESGHGGHLIVRLGMNMSVFPMHGKQKELGTGLVNAIKKQLGLK